MKVQVREPFKYFFGLTVGYHPRFSQALGESHTVGVLLSQLMYHWRENDEREFHLPLEILQDQTGVPRNALAAARERLVELGLAQSRYSRTEHKLYWTVDLSRLEELCNVYLSSKDGAAEVQEQRERWRAWIDGGGRVPRHPSESEMPRGSISENQECSPLNSRDGTSENQRSIIIEDKRKIEEQERGGGDRTVQSPKVEANGEGRSVRPGGRMLTLHLARDLWNEFAASHPLPPLPPYNYDPRKIRDKFLKPLREAIRDRTEDELLKAYEIAHAQDWIFDRQVATFPWITTHMQDFLDGVYGSVVPPPASGADLHPEYRFKQIPGPQDQVVNDEEKPCPIPNVRTK